MEVAEEDSPGLMGKQGMGRGGRGFLAWGPVRMQLSGWKSGSGESHFRLT